MGYQCDMCGKMVRDDHNCWAPTQWKADAKRLDKLERWLQQDTKWRRVYFSENTHEFVAVVGPGVAAEDRTLRDLIDALEVEVLKCDKCEAWTFGMGETRTAAFTRSTSSTAASEGPMNHVDFKFAPLQFVQVRLFGLNYDGRVVRCVWNGRHSLYDVEYARDGHLDRREFLEDELQPGGPRA